MHIYLKVGAELSTQEKRFVLYEYLLFFWRKKWAFVIIPVIMIALGAIASQVLLKDTPYEGKATVFTGSIKSKGLTDPEIVESKYKEFVTGGFDAYVAKDSYIKLTVNGNDAETIESELSKVTESLLNDLQVQADIRLNITTNYITSLENRIPVLQKAQEIYQNQLEKENLELDEQDNYRELAVWTEGQLTDAQATLTRIQGDLAFFEEPTIVSSTVGKTNTYLKESMALGAILGLLATVAFLILWKYLFDARRYYEHD
ncbi:lipopolysaccharide biosynthesis protein [Cytobacillus suaedae]|nr:lipopolysaccharide biosynthesis protein [Cytobacillus suaedae]